MGYWKIRIFAVVLIALSAFGIYYNWQQLQLQGRYYPKMAVFTPVGVIGGFFMLLFPSRAGKPTTTGERIIVILVFAIGVIAGVINLYLMDPAFFGR